MRTLPLVMIALVLNIAVNANAQEFKHSEHELFYMALDIRKINKLDIYSHSLSYNADLSKGLIGSTLVLPHKIGDSFEISTRAIFIYIDPVMVNFFSKNDWAFMISHEFAHLLLANKGFTGVELERKCNIDGADYAIKAGYDLNSFLETLSKFSDSSCSATYGCPDERLANLQKYFKKKR